MIPVEQMLDLYPRMQLKYEISVLCFWQWPKNNEYYGNVLCDIGSSGSPIVLLVSRSVVGRSSSPIVPENVAGGVHVSWMTCIAAAETDCHELGSWCQQLSITRKIEVRDR